MKKNKKRGDKLIKNENASIESSGNEIMIQYGCNKHCIKNASQ